MIPGLWALLVCLCLVVSLPGSSQETNQTSVPQAAGPPDTNSQEILRAVLGLQDQLRSNQAAIETALDQNAKATREATAHNQELFSNGLQTVRESFAASQQALADRTGRQLREVQDSNRALVLVGGVFAAVASLVLLLVGYFQWRISKAWSQISRMLPASLGLGHGSGYAALAQGEPASTPGLADSGNSHLVNVLERLETRVQSLEHHSVAPHAPGGNGDPVTPTPHPAATMTAPGADARINAWLQQGHSLLKQNNWQGALECFEAVLALSPDHTEALVRKGAALERMKKINEAFECYDHAIAVDESMTAAYLHKGGLCNRLERFKEALECYEKALRTHDDWEG